LFDLFGRAAINTQSAVTCTDIAVIASHGRVVVGAVSPVPLDVAGRRAFAWWGPRVVSAHAAVDSVVFLRASCFSTICPVFIVASISTTAGKVSVRIGSPLALT
jgi:hypothetical protein